MTGAQFAALAVTWAAAIMLPGPDILQIIRLGAHDRRAGMWCAVGIMVGNALWITASLVGLAALIAANPNILAIIQVVGGCYILYLGVGSFRAGVAGLSQARSKAGATMMLDQDQSGSGVVSLLPVAALRTGVLTNLSNPKAVVFFAAIFAQFIPPGVTWSVVVAGFLIVTGLVWFVGFAWGVSVMAEKLVRHGAVIDVGAGLIFVGIGVWMLIEGGLGVMQTTW